MRSHRWSGELTGHVNREKEPVLRQQELPAQVLDLGPSRLSSGHLILSVGLSHPFSSREALEAVFLEVLDALHLPTNSRSQLEFAVRGGLAPNFSLAIK